MCFAPTEWWWYSSLLCVRAAALCHGLCGRQLFLYMQSCAVRVSLCPVNLFAHVQFCVKDYTCFITLRMEWSLQYSLRSTEDNSTRTGGYGISGLFCSLLPNAMLPSNHACVNYLGETVSCRHGVWMQNLRKNICCLTTNASKGIEDKIQPCLILRN